jgi:alcohol dehydrogenase
VSGAAARRTAAADPRKGVVSVKALVYHGPGQKSWDTVDDPKATEPTDVVVQIDTTTICGTDLHILKGDVPTVEPGRVLGHEAVGTVVATGSAVTGLNDGDRVLVPAITSCGRCAYCKRGMPSHCQAVGGIGWIFGHLVDGTQAEYARVPYAETSVHAVPEGVTDEQVLFLADILPTGYEVGVRNGRVAPGDVVAVIGAGPVGLAAIMTARLSGASRVIAVDPAPSRREHASRFGADDAVAGSDELDDLISAGTADGLGVDVAIEAVGVPETFELCARIVRPGGVVANIGVHGAPAVLHLEELWIKNVTITTGLVDGTSIPRLLRLASSGKIQSDLFGTHTFGLSEMLDAYDVFAHAGEHNALKVVIKRQ